MSAYGSDRDAPPPSDRALFRSEAVQRFLDAPRPIAIETSASEPLQIKRLGFTATATNQEFDDALRGLVSFRPVNRSFTEIIGGPTIRTGVEDLLNHNHCDPTVAPPARVLPQRGYST